MIEPPDNGHDPALDLSIGDDASLDRSTAEGSRRATAVALKKYGIDESSLPKIVAAGYGVWAEKIVALAFQNGVKVREDKDLAQLLAAIELDSDIPAEALVAVAEILAYVYKANGTPHADIAAQPSAEVPAAGDKGKDQT